MRQLTSLDAQFLALETPRQSGHVASVAILDPQTPTGPLELADIQDLIAERLPLLPPMRCHRALPAELLQDANHFIPPAVLARASRATFTLSTSNRGRPTWNLVISNVPGPQVPLYCAGAQLKANYPVSVITDGMGLNITVMSYCGHLDFGIVADRDQTPDVWSVMDWLGEALEELKPSRRKKAAAAAS